MSQEPNCWQKRTEILGLILTPEYDASRLLPLQLTSPFLCGSPQLNKHGFLLASSCPHRFYGRGARWWWDPVRLWGCRWRPADAGHMQVPFGTSRRLGAPRYSWVCPGFVIGPLRCRSRLHGAIFSINWVLTAPFLRGIPWPWTALECRAWGETMFPFANKANFWLLWGFCNAFSSFGQACWFSISDDSSIIWVPLYHILLKRKWNHSLPSTVQLALRTNA